VDDGGRSAQIVRFGVFEADLESGELRKNGLKVPLQGQPFQVFAFLLQHSGELVTRDDLRQKVWPEDTFVDFDHGLNTAITKIRAALGDDADNPRFVETLPRRGYRFLVPVDKPSSQAPSARAPTRRFDSMVRWSCLGVGVAALFLLSTIAIWRLFPKSAESLLPALEVIPLVDLKGMQITPAFSPDGNQVAFAEFGQPNTSGIYTTLIGGEKPLRLTDNPGDCCPTWSPDSREIAFVRYSSGEGMSIYVVPALGGTEHKLYTEGHPMPGGTRLGMSPDARVLDWSPDGRVLAFEESIAKGPRSQIALLSLADLTTRPLTSPPDQEYDSTPAFSPDGSSVAYTRQSLGGLGRDLFVIPDKGGEPRRLTFDNSGGSPTWTQDGRDIVFSYDGKGLASLWRVSASGGTPRPVPGVGARAFSPSIPRKGNQLVYMHVDFSERIWRINLKDKTHALAPPVPVISARGVNWRPNFSPDGKKIVFESNRLGYSDIWYCDSDGSNCAQLTSMYGTAGTARWSPDGHYVVFESQSQHYYQIYVVEVPGGRPRLVPTFPDADNGAPNWSRDGKWIYFYSLHEKGLFQLWKLPFEGGSPVQVTRNGGVYAIESDDGRFLYYSKEEEPGIWKMPLNGGEETRILDQPKGWSSWALVRGGIYFVNSSNPSNGRIEFFDFITRETTAIFSPEKPSLRIGSLAVSPDGKSLLYDRIESLDAYIMLVKNFR
jgi:Tol biopolymer transport system component/DNA-binding winged helix-turn-helix (wHTH) protein